VGKNIRMNIRQIAVGDIEWKDLVQDRDQWRALVKMVMNFRVLQNVGKFSSG
jgi:hypothetical protein